MKKDSKLMIILRAYIFVLLCTLNTWCIAKDKIIFILSLSGLISITWTYNVRSAALGSWIDRICYSLGAFLGCASALIISKLL